MKYENVQQKNNHSEQLDFSEARSFTFLHQVAHSSAWNLEHWRGCKKITFKNIKLPCIFHDILSNIKNSSFGFFKFPHFFSLIYFHKINKTFDWESIYFSFKLSSVDKLPFFISVLPSVLPLPLQVLKSCVHTIVSRTHTVYTL